jgi:putative transposase
VARPALKREVVDYIVSHYGLQIRRACRLIKQYRSVQYYKSVKDPKLALRNCMREIAQTRVRYGYRRVHVLLKREGWQLGKNQMYRLYSEEQLQLRSKLPKRRKMVVTRQAKVKPTKPNEAWSMDFVADQLANGMKFRTLTIVDVFSKEALAIEVGQRLRSEHVVATLNRLAAQRNAPKYLFVDNGPEYVSAALAAWAKRRGIRLEFIQPGKPQQNAYIERYNRTVRYDWLAHYLFDSIEEVQDYATRWLWSYNHERPNMAIGGITPKQKLALAA